jgi:hypothetical protein
MIVGPGRSLLDPVFQHRNLFRSEGLSFRRHDFIRIVGRDALKKAALGWFPWNNSRFAGIASGKNILPIFNPKSAFLFFWVVALDTSFLEDGQDLFMEINGVGGRIGWNQ